VFTEYAGKDATEIYEDSEHPTWADNQLAFYLVGEVLEEEDYPLKAVDAAESTQ
jgi:cytochrome b involved in lipid metabolism